MKLRWTPITIESLTLSKSDRFTKVKAVTEEGLNTSRKEAMNK